MKTNIGILAMSILLLACGTKNTKQPTQPKVPAITGTWKLISATVIEKGDTTKTDYTNKMSFIKIINDTHFAFLQHDLNKGKDSAVFSSGGGSYSLKDSLYTEHLEYCSARDWEGNDFTFTINLKGDTLIQRGIEKVESAGVDRVNMEMYTRVNK